MDAIEVLNGMKLEVDTMYISFHTNSAISRGCYKKRYWDDKAVKERRVILITCVIPQRIFFI